MDPITPFFVGLLTTILQGISGPIQPLMTLVGTTPLAFTTANALVITGWKTMTAVADGLLALLVTVKALQMMYGQSRGRLSMPVGQFVPKVILTALLMPLGFLPGRELILLNNLLCRPVQATVMDFIKQVNGGEPFHAGQARGIAAVLALVLTISLLRVIFQAVKGIVFFAVLLVPSPGPVGPTALNG
jgi:hypothetical protein